MRTSRIAVCAAVVGALALPLVSIPTASAATTVSSCETRPIPYKVHTKAVTIRSKASSKSTALGVLYRSHKFTVLKSSGKLALHHGQDHRRKGMGVRKVCLPRHGHVPGLADGPAIPLPGIRVRGPLPNGPDL